MSLRKWLIQHKDDERPLVDPFAQPVAQREARPPAARGRPPKTPKKPVAVLSDDDDDDDEAILQRAKRVAEESSVRGRIKWQRGPR